MIGQPFRLPQGGVVDRSQPLQFEFDGRQYTGFRGDTLASALLANGVRLVGRSFKYHRPRGILSIGIEEPNALVELDSGASLESNQRATMVELRQGLVVHSQNRWPSLRFDVMAINDLLSRFIPAGFYYKTFMWPGGAWLFYERHIRRAAGRGQSSRMPDPDRYEKVHDFCDELVIGCGAAGLSAALAAGERGSRVLLVDENAVAGGSLRFERETVDGIPAQAWINRAVGQVDSMPNVKRLARTTVFGWYDGMTFGAVERVADHLDPQARNPLPRQRLRLIHARRVVFATGAIEQPIAFADNDRPGIMLASAVRGYLNHFAVQPGRCALVFTTHDDAYQTALDLHDAGISVAAVVDPRTEIAQGLRDALSARGITHLPGYAVLRAYGSLAVKGVSVAPVSAEGTPRDSVSRNLACDLVAVGGGWAPSLHLTSHRGARPRMDAALNRFVPDGLPESTVVVGSAQGCTTTINCIDSARETIQRVQAGNLRNANTGERSVGPWWVRTAPEGGKRFVDLDGDVTIEDIELAHREGYVSVEHLKRYTTLGMGTDQGKTSSLSALAIMAAMRGEAVASVGTTTFRPPYSPVALGVFAGHETGRRYEPIRRTALHAWHERNGAHFTEAGLWLRPRAYPRTGETIDSAYRREAAHVRQHAGLIDVSTLGKIDIQGPDATKLLERVYVNHWNTLPQGRVRYGLMLREDGIVLDDGTCARLGPSHYVMTTTTANAAKVLAHLEFALQVLWPELRVHVASVTEQWAAMALAGPRARAVLARCASQQDVSDATLPPQGFCVLEIAGVPVRAFRISYSGELSYELNVPAGRAEHVWEFLIEHGAAEQLKVYGTEAMGALRIEKGHVAGPELDGRTTADDLGLGRMVKQDGDYIGKILAQRPGLVDPGRPKLVGLISESPDEPIPAGAHLVSTIPGAGNPSSEGHVTSVTWSPALKRYIGLGLLTRGRQRMDEFLTAADPLRGRMVRVRVTSPVFFDPAGERMHA